jgi:hypothetical protein
MMPPLGADLPYKEKITSSKPNLAKNVPHFVKMF